MLCPTRAVERAVEAALKRFLDDIEEKARVRRNQTSGK